MPNVLIKKGLAEAVQFFIEDIRQGNPMHIHLTYSELPLLEEQSSINIYRILQEVVHNTIKHAGASRLAIDINFNQDCLTVITKDDGKGFDYEGAMKNNFGLGLRNLLSRTEMLGGKMFIETKKGSGTTYIFEIPLK